MVITSRGIREVVSEVCVRNFAGAAIPGPRGNGAPKVSHILWSEVIDKSAFCSILEHNVTHDVGYGPLLAVCTGILVFPEVPFEDAHVPVWRKKEVKKG